MNESDRRNSGMNSQKDDMPSPEEASAYFQKLVAGKEAELQAQAQAEGDKRWRELLGLPAQARNRSSAILEGAISGAALGFVCWLVTIKVRPELAASSLPMLLGLIGVGLIVGARLGWIRSRRA